MAAVQGLLGVVATVALCWLLSEQRRAIPWRPVLIGLALQPILALILLKTPGAATVFLWLNGAVLALQEATEAGTAFVFGFVGGAPLPFEEPYPGAAYVLAFRALPLILVVSALTSVLFYWRILPVIVQGIAWGLRRTMGVGGAVGLSAAANIFVGMVESPLFIRPYIEKMGRGELFMMMTVGMATIAGTMMVIYASILGGLLDAPLAHILIASIISAPAALAIALMLVPGDPEEAPTEAKFKLPPPEAHSTMEAVLLGTRDGITLVINVTAMLLVMVALVSLVNQALGLLPDVGGEPLTLQHILGWIMAPVVWLIGIPWSEATAAGALMGTKTILNEMLAYLDMANLPADALSPKSELIMAYALCGFANFGSLGIMLGGLTAMAPERRADIVSLGGRTILSGTLATLMTGAVVGLVAG
ncbi:nucleoside:proton symporter [Roseospira marina]|uniref:Nucleoside:proton symporter n=1 Tax=Roseospira marina TaxID=140057 RepID=A0A5M6IB90_9PROT|nr:nucleoside transporter C-terminal domain-containing protein [Roseospira marina]KAA5605570.1 nucleoside:proton symporter [Roseospira marina]MBB4313367.1 CNT family concentrative nucleoside transporter [Roseospira marina]MBB5085892.1 CNT family concentrative nucleoside transporter [Roseospira marina]